MDAFLPGVEGSEPIYNNPLEWHFRFFGPTPVALVKGCERLYFEHFWNDFAANAKRPGRMAAGFAYFASFQQTAKAFAVWLLEEQPAFTTAARTQFLDGAAS